MSKRHEESYVTKKYIPPKKEQVEFSGANVAYLHLSMNCNLQCQYCYMKENTSAPELSTDEWCRTLDILWASGCTGVNLTGGEALLREDFSVITKSVY